MNDDVWLVVPLFNEERVIGDVVRRASRVFPNIVCVDDGSSDGSAAEAAVAGAVVVRHPVNLGQGAALQTGFTYALSVPSMRWAVTVPGWPGREKSTISRLTVLLDVAPPATSAISQKTATSARCRRTNLVIRVTRLPPRLRRFAGDAT